MKLNNAIKTLTIKRMLDGGVLGRKCFLDKEVNLIYFYKFSEI